MHPKALPAAGIGVLVFTLTNSLLYVVAALALLAMWTTVQSGAWTWQAAPASVSTPPMTGDLT